MTHQTRRQDARVQRMAGATVVAAALTFPSISLAQNALGNGRALDANLSTQSRYNQPRQGFLLNRINDAIVTGTAPGGMNFRGDVGYTSTFAFRGGTARQESYGFERDSYYSNIAPRRGAPRQPNVLGLYQVPGPSTRGGDSPYAAGAAVLTPMSGANLQEIARARYGTSLPDLSANATSQQFRPQRALASPTLDATADSVLDRNLNIASRAALNTIDPFLDRSSLLAASASGLLTPPNLTGSGLDAGSSALPSNSPVIRNSLTRGIDGTFDGVSFREGWSNRIAPISAASPSANEPLLAGQDSYADYVARMSTRNTAQNLPEAGQPYSTDAMAKMRQFSKDVLGIDTEAQMPSVGPAPANPLEALSADKLNQISQPLPPIASLAGDNTSQFADHVRLGETALAEGRYFDAESWFDVSLYYTPDHPLAIAGRVHAQLGAGKYRSAALGLRRLFEAHPELINTQYASNLLPRADRLNDDASELAEMLTRPGATVEAGLLLAYIGHLTNRPALITQGLDDLDAKQPGDPLTGVLRRVWLNSDQP